MKRRFHKLLCVTGLLLLPALALAQRTRGPLSAPGAATMLGFQGLVEVQRAENARWDPTYTNQVLDAGNRVRTDKNSYALLRFSDLETIRIGPRSIIRVESKGERKRGFDFFKGILYFFHRDKPDEFEVRTPQMAAIIRGTEFTLEVADDETTTLSLIDGQVRLSNPQSGSGDTLDLNSGEQAVIEPGKTPRRTAIIEAVNLVQWCLYYPAVLNLDDLRLTAEEQQTLGSSLAAYRSGDLPAALAAYPAARQPASDDERVYLAALLLSVGGVAEAEEQLRPLLADIRADNRPTKLAGALRKLIAAVKFQESATPASPDSSTALLAESYYQQSRSKLDEALAAARASVRLAPNFAFGWARVAELEFGFGRISAARDAAEKSLQLAPRNAEALALRGFLLAAQNRIPEALATFDQALAADSKLGHAWLGRGLCRIRQGQARTGREDLQVAATLEPNRAAFRSYLGKAFHEAGDRGDAAWFGALFGDYLDKAFRETDTARALRELNLAQKLDPRDPTAWLYSALLKQQENRVNEAVRDLEHSQALNKNRSVYRSRLLLDQDQAVRGANLATLYEDAGMTEVSAREAARAVGLDYANYSAHLFLANSYNALRDPRQINLRYETPWLSEYLVANLLAPAQAGTLSPFVTQQDYAHLFERDRFGLSSATEYLSRGDWIQSAVQYGIQGNFSYAAEVYYRTENGQRSNNDLDQLTTTLRLKQQITPQDSVFFQAIYYNAETGDVTPYYNVKLPVQQGGPNPGLRTRETQEPIALVGYHHQWSPGVDTLVLGGRLDDTFEVSNPRQTTLVLEKNPPGPLASVIPIGIGQAYRSKAEIYTAEIQQIIQRRPHTFIVGSRYQTGDFTTRNQPAITDSDVAPFFMADQFVVQNQHIDSDFDRLTGYGYHHLQVGEPLVLIAGVSYDRLTAPRNFRYAPLSSGDDITDQVSPKAGFIWTPLKHTTIRGAYSRSLSGVAFDQSFQLEPSQIAGFNQAYRSIIPESVVGANAGAKFEVFGLALDQKSDSGTYLGVSCEWLRSDVKRRFGVYDDDSTNVVNVPPYIFPSSTRQTFDYSERSLTITVNQLLGDEWSLGARYRLSRAELDDHFTDVPDKTPTVPGFSPRQNLDATLHQLTLYNIYTHPSGIFAQGEALWYAQENHGYSGTRPGDDVWQFNLFVGYRFPKRRAEVRVGLLNITDRDYRLNPLNLTTELPRDRTFVASVKFHF
jgi:Tfp pilus assembly protein PilF